MSIDPSSSRIGGEPDLQDPNVPRSSPSRRPRLSLRAQGAGTLVFPMGILFLALFSVYWAEQRLRSGERAVAQAQEMRTEIVELRSALNDASALAGEYAATAEGLTRDAYGVSRQTAARALRNMAAIAENHPAGRAQFGKVERLAREELGQIDRAVASRAAPAGATTELSIALTLLNDEEERELAQAAFDLDESRRQLFRVLMMCGVAGPIGALFIEMILARRLTRRVRRVEENARRLAAGQPLLPLPAGTDEVASLGRQLEHTAALLRAHERNLREGERRYRELFDQAPVPYMETDTDGVICRFNQALCNLLRVAPERIPGAHAWDFADPDQTDALRTAFLAKIQQRAETGPYECNYQLDDGSRIHVEIRENFIRDSSGQVTGVCRSVLDVTERELAAVAARKVEQYALELRNRNEQLARAFEAATSATVAKSQFLASMSHELRTPLNSIIGFAEMIVDGRLGPISTEHRDCLADILTSAHHLLELINDILDLSKVEAGKTEFRPELCRIDRLVAEVRDVLRPLAEKKNLQLRSEVVPGLEALIDPSRFKQVLYNFLSNAVKFTAENGRVTVRITSDLDETFRLEVEDTGVGIPPEEIKQLWEEFQQLTGGRKDGQGSGLGLALTRRIVEAQGGTVDVRSVPGEGSVFIAVLPLRSVTHATVPVA
ncbi:MAG TPA: ATP-binding protein [Bryobacteraceae bacterium]